MDLDRFVAAQAPVMDQVLAELKAGQKASHWMWFVFPQLQSLGRSQTAMFYGLSDVDEARRYLAHPVLRARLLDCTRTVLAHCDKTAHQIFGSPDDVKFRSCMTLFMLAAPEVDVFRQALDAFYSGVPDPHTVQASRQVGLG